MPVLESAQQEKFAQNLARGMPQGKSYTMAGYRPNAGAASKLAKIDSVRLRVEEIKEELRTQTTALMQAENPDMALATLEEMGLDLMWCAHAFQKIYEQATAAGQFGAANTAVQSIQKIVETQARQDTSPEADAKKGVNISDVTDMLNALNTLVTSSKERAPEDLAADRAALARMRDITPPEDSE